ncbi:Electron transport complex subunit RsxD [Thalassocella blandensis]|nr:Electron transport complex subunit RsxD [Thalassocella blandensis]
MALLKITSPHVHGTNSTSRVMAKVALACAPGIMALTLWFGFGSLCNIILCIGFCLSFEAIALKLRQRDVRFFLSDFSAVVTALLLGIALPPFAPWWLIAIGSFFSIVVAKQLYGGLGFNPFNPAMVGYVVLLISFPVEMTTWLPAMANSQGLGTIEGLAQVFAGHAFTSLDAYTGATPLDIVKQNSSAVLSDLYQQQSVFKNSHFAGTGWEWVNLAFLGGGIYLLWRKIFTWHAPISMLGTLAVLSALFYDGGSSSSPGSPLLHLFSGGTMLGAFFIVTDPVTSAVSNKGRVVYGIGIGALVFVIRAWGNYPDAIAFSVLLMNFAAPFIDYYTQPRTYGHVKKPGKPSQK